MYVRGRKDLCLIKIVRILSCLRLHLSGRLEFLMYMRKQIHSTTIYRAYIYTHTYTHIQVISVRGTRTATGLCTATRTTPRTTTITPRACSDSCICIQCLFCSIIAFGSFQVYGSMLAIYKYMYIYARAGMCVYIW